MRELVLDDSAPFVMLVKRKRGKETDYQAKMVMLAGRPYTPLTETEIEQDGKRFTVRSAFTPHRTPRYPCGRHCGAAHRPPGLSLQLKCSAKPPPAALIAVADQSFGKNRSDEFGASSCQLCQHQGRCRRHAL